MNCQRANKASDIAIRKKERETGLSREINKKLTKAPLDDLKNEQAATRESLKKLGEGIGVLKHKLADNTDAKARYQQKQRFNRGTQNRMHEMGCAAFINRFC